MSHSNQKNEGEQAKQFAKNTGVMDDENLQVIHSQLLREKAEPTENMAPIPLSLIFFFGLLLFWGGFYMSKYSGNFRSDVFSHNWIPGAVTPVEAAFDSIAQGKKLFTRTCQQCHQPDGMGLPSVYPPLVGSTWLLGSEERPIKILIAGLSGPVTVEGKKFDGNMPAVGEWKDRDIAAVLTYVRQQWGNNASEITEDRVKQVRDSIQGRNKLWSEKELLELHPL